MVPDAPECTFLAVHHNEQKSSGISKSEYAPPEIIMLHNEILCHF